MIMYFLDFKKKDLTFFSYFFRNLERAATPSFLEQASQHFNLEYIPISQLDRSDIDAEGWDIRIVKLTRK